jgi:hypothetical protein
MSNERLFGPLPSDSSALSLLQHPVYREGPGVVAVEGAAEVPVKQEGQGRTQGPTQPPSRTNQGQESASGRCGDGREGHHKKIFSTAPVTAPDATNPFPGLAARPCNGSARGSAGGLSNGFWSGSAAGWSAERSARSRSNAAVTPSGVHEIPRARPAFRDRPDILRESAAVREGSLRAETCRRTSVPARPGEWDES